MAARRINITRATVTDGDGLPVASRAYVNVEGGRGRVLVDNHVVAAMPIEETVVVNHASWRLTGPDGTWIVKKVGCCGRPG